ncbi:MAG: DinB family protein [Blastocatellia bacterium]
MAYRSLADILAANEAAHTRFVAAVSNLSSAQLNFRPAQDRWTIAENAEHVSIVNDGFLRITHKLLKQAEAAGKSSKTELDLGHTTLDKNGNQHPAKFPAPDRVKPPGEAKVDDSLAKMRETLDGFAAIKEWIEATDLTEEKFPHPAIGEINAYQWMILLGEHNDRHRLQVEQIKASTGYPA